jgi:hypothetical protein
MRIPNIDGRSWWRRPAAVAAAVAVGACTTCAAHAGAAVGDPAKDAAKAGAQPAVQSATKAGGPTSANAATQPGGSSVDWNAVVEHYAAIAATLASDKTAGISEHAKALSKALGPEPAAQGAKAAGDQAPSPHAAAARLQAEKLTVDEARAAFKPLSEALLPLAKTNYQKDADDPAWAVFHCPMAPGSWIQTGDVAANPYYGAKMLKCGVKQGVLGQKPADDPAAKGKAQG